MNIDSLSGRDFAISVQLLHRILPLSQKDTNAGSSGRQAARKNLYFLKAITQFTTTISLSLSLFPTYFLGSLETASTRKSSNYSSFRGSLRQRSGVGE